MFTGRVKLLEVFLLGGRVNLVVFWFLFSAW